MLLATLLGLASAIATDVGTLSAGTLSAAGSIVIDAVSGQDVAPGNEVTVDFHYEAPSDGSPELLYGAASVQDVVVSTDDGAIDVGDGLIVSVQEVAPGAYRLTISVPPLYPQSNLTIFLSVFTQASPADDAHTPTPIQIPVVSAPPPFPVSPILAGLNDTPGQGLFTNGTCAPTVFQSQLRVTVDPLDGQLRFFQPDAADENLGPFTSNRDGSMSFLIENPNGDESYQGVIGLDGRFIDVVTEYRGCFWDVDWQPDVISVPLASFEPGWSPFTMPAGVQGDVSTVFRWAPSPITIWTLTEDDFLWAFFHPATGQGTDFSTEGTALYVHNTGPVATVPLVTAAPAPPARPVDPADVPIVSTRGHFADSIFADPALTSGHTATDYGFDLSTLGCPEELVIYVHGFQNSPADAQENFNTARAALRANGYTQPVVGFSWDSDVGALDFDDAKAIATMNGKKLAQFIADFQAQCPDTKIRLIGHSLGTRVILNALQELDGNQDWRASGSQVRSVHVVGAAVDDEEVDKSEFGTAIENQVGEFHNLYSPEDDVLSDTYVFEEGDQALGEDGAEFSSEGRPSNYSEEDVSLELSRDIDGNGSPDESNLGDNHSGYNGVVNSSGTLTSDGAMDRVVEDWTQQESGN